MAESIADAIEAEIARLSRQLTEPGERECLRCFLLRMISEFGCDGGHRWARQWQRLRAPRAAALLRRLAELGGCCDCEILLNVFTGYPDSGRPLPCVGQPQVGSAVPCNLRSLRRTA